MTTLYILALSALAAITVAYAAMAMNEIRRLWRNRNER